MFNKLLIKLSYLSRNQRRCIFLLADSIIILLSFYLTFSINEESFYLNGFISNFFLYPTLILISIPIYISFGHYRGLSKYLGGRSFFNLAISNLITIFLLYLFNFFISGNKLTLNFWFLFWFILTFSIFVYRIIIRNKLRYIDIYSNIKKKKMF